MIISDVVLPVRVSSFCCIIRKGKRFTVAGQWLVKALQGPGHSI